MLTREEILGRKPKRRTVEVPEWDGSVLIQALPYVVAEEMNRENKLIDFVMLSCIREDGSLLFSSEDRERLAQQEFAPLRRIAEAAVEFNGLSKKSGEELAGNFEPGPNGSSSSA